MIDQKTLHNFDGENCFLRVPFSKQQRRLDIPTYQCCDATNLTFYRRIPSKKYGVVD